MSPLRRALADYLAARRALGYKLLDAEKLLAQFIAYLEEHGAQTVTADHALAWATLPGGADNWHYQRLAVVRCFARHLQAVDPATEVPAAELLRWRRPRTVPYIYSTEQIAALMSATASLRRPHRAATYRTLIGLLVVSGMRIGEAIRLDRGDVDLGAGLIVVRDTKFGKTRELPLHPSSVAALRRYLHRAGRPRSPGGAEPLFVSTTGTRLAHSRVTTTFHELLARAGIELRSECCRPRLHDLRHSFAVRTILDGYRGSGEIEGRLATLSTYLGHSEPANTYWYLSAVPELMGLAAERLERHFGDRS
jgi:integrase